MTGRVALPCGVPFCAGAVRMVYALNDMAMVRAAGMVGISETTLAERAERLGCPPRLHRKNLRHVSRDRLLAAYADQSVPLAVAAGRIGLSARVLLRRVAGLGVPQRHPGPKAYVPWPQAFDAMWMAGVLVTEMAGLIGCSVNGVMKEAARRGLPCRRSMAGARITLAAFRARVAVVAMGQTARAESGARRRVETRGAA